MSARAALVDCVVVCLQDVCVFYPCCRGCFSRVQAEPPDTKRYRCFKCGYNCLRENVDYRYRLTLKVTRDKSIFGVTVFGTCLNTFFGICATDLQRLVEGTDGPVGAANRSALFVKAVQDCFIGRRFIFGIKVPETEPEPWLQQPVFNGSGSRDPVQLIASQMILPNALGLGGCTVISYYRTLLQRAAEYESASADPSKSSSPPETPLLLLPHHVPASSYNRASLSTTALLDQPLKGSQYQDCTLTPTPPWQQSLGLVTSSAEQEESCSTQDKEKRNGRQTHKNHTQNPTPKNNLNNIEVTDESLVSPLRPLHSHLCRSPSMVKYSYSPVKEAAGNTSISELWFSLYPSVNNSSKRTSFCLGNLAKTHLSESLAWENLPFSESLTEFLGEENKDFAIAGESKTDLSVQNQEEAAKDSLEVGSQDKNLTKSTSVCQSFIELIDSPAQNEADRQDLSGMMPAGCMNKSQTRDIFSQEVETSYSASFENEEQVEDDPYNFSADLFSSSLLVDVKPKTLKAQEDTARTSTGACFLLSVPNRQHLRTEMTNITPYKQKPESNKSSMEDDLNPPGALDFDFVPPSQSTPIVRPYPSTFRDFSTKSHSPESFYRKLPDFDSIRRAQIRSSKSKCAGANQLPQCAKQSTKENWDHSSKFSRHRLNSERRFWKHKHRLLTQQNQRRTPNTETPGRLKYTSDSSSCDMTLCENDRDDTLFVPPTPAAKSLLSIKLRGRSQTEDSCSSLGLILDEQQEDRVNCRNSVIATQTGVIPTGYCDTEISEKRTLDGSVGHLLDGESDPCDWSRDLFSDSV